MPIAWFLLKKYENYLILGGFNTTERDETLLALNSVDKTYLAW